MKYIFLVSVATLAITYVQGFSSGAPEGVCEDMTPKHPATPQESQSPYSLIINKKQITPGGTVKIVISSPAQLKFKGFFVQARVGNTPVGTFSVNPSVNKVINCLGGRQNAATHIDAKSKSRVTLTWTAPKDLAESVTFVATVAKNGGEYWVGQQSEPIDVVAVA